MVRYLSSSVFDLFGLWLDDMPHLSARLARLIWGEQAIGTRDLDVRWHVTVRTGQGRSLDTRGSELSLEGFALAALFGLLASTHGVALQALPLHLRVFGRRQSLLKVLETLFKNCILLLFLLLEFEGLRLEHGKLRDCGKHLSGKLSRSSLVLVDFLCNFQCCLSAIEGLRTKLFSQVAYLFEDELFLKKGLFFVIEALLEDVNLREKSFLIWILAG